MEEERVKVGGSGALRTVPFEEEGAFCFAGEEVESFDVTVGLRARGGEISAPIEVPGDMFDAGVSCTFGSLARCIAGDDIEPADIEGVMNDVHPPELPRPLVRAVATVACDVDVVEALMSMLFFLPNPVRLANRRNPV